MSARNEVDNKNINRLKKIICNYPDIMGKYINSMSSKTSYTKLYYGINVCNFLDYLKSEIKLNINNYNDEFKKIKPMHIDSYMEYIRYTKNGKEKSGMSRATQLAAIKNFFSFLYRNRIIEYNPCENIEIPKDNGDHEIITISDNDMRIIMKNIEYGVGSQEAIKKQMKWKTRDKAIVLLGITTGLRMGAIIGIDLEDINLKEKTITVIEKGDKKRIIYFGNNTAKALEDWLCDRELIIKDVNEKAVFISHNNTRMSSRTMERIMQRVTYGTSKRITPHKMRATCATKLYEQTGDIYLVQQQLGHKSIKNTERYAKVSEEKRIKAANILDSLV